MDTALRQQNGALPLQNKIEERIIVLRAKMNIFSSSIPNPNKTLSMEPRTNLAGPHLHA